MANFLSEYPERYRDQLAACAALSDRIRQLAEAHPLAFFAIATGYGPLDARRTAVRLTELGFPLREVCAALGIAHALRRIEPAALGAPLCEARLSERAAQVLAGRVSRMTTASAKARALAAAFYGTRICDEVFGLWLADPRNVARLPEGCFEPLRGLALYAWCSCRPHLLPEAVWPRLWSQRMSWPSAVSSARLWLDHLKFHLYFGATPIADTWAEGASVDGYEFVPLCGFDELIGEVHSMRNCLHSYADKLLANQCRLFGVRRHGLRAGTIEIVPDAARGVRISEFRGPHNASMPLEAWHAAHRWIERQQALDASATPARLPGGQQTALGELLARHAEERRLPLGFWKDAPTLTGLARELRSLEALRRRHPQRDAIREELLRHERSHRLQTDTPRAA